MTILNKIIECWYFFWFND